MIRTTLALIAIVSLALAGCAPAEQKTEPPAEPAKKTEQDPAGKEVADKEAPTVIQSSTGLTELKKEDVNVGNGQQVAEGDLALVTYTGTFADGKEFDSNDKPDGTPFAFVVGAGRVIKGWDQGVVGMKVGGTRKLSIPYSLGYGENGSGDKIPGKTDLFFTIKLLDVVKKGEEGVYDKTDIKVGTGPEAKKGETLYVHYVGRLVNGKEFDNSRKRDPKNPFNFVLGGGTVIPGWDAGMQGMRKGGVRRLRIPPAIAYGENGPPGIGSNQILIFEIELLDIKSQADAAKP
jgi:FKBP-type peptidyl-prolyl cis-trans isomerase